MDLVVRIGDGRWRHWSLPISLRHLDTHIMLIRHIYPYIWIYMHIYKHICIYTPICNNIFQAVWFLLGEWMGGESGRETCKLFRKYTWYGQQH